MPRFPPRFRHVNTSGRGMACAAVDLTATRKQMREEGYVPPVSQRQRVALQ